MRLAAGAVAAAARVMLQEPWPPIAEQGRVLLLVGAGGNGGDALYAGAELLEHGTGVDAVLLGRDGRVHRPALEAFEEAGGRVLAQLPLPQRYRLFIDGILGLGGSGGLQPEVAELLDDAHSQRVPVLAIDVPSGIPADTGALPDKVRVQARGLRDEAAEMRTQVVPAHVRATVTVTFGGLRRAHAVTPDCGEVRVADLHLPTETGTLSLYPELMRTFTRDFSAGAPEIRAELGWVPVKQRYDWSGSKRVDLHPVSPGLFGLRTQPGPDADKYSGGVVGVCAGSDAYRGAAVLSTAGAVRATSSMVRYVGSGWEEVVRALPEVIAHDDLTTAGRVQAWVVGPGRGTDDAAHEELRRLLERPEPLLIDADAVTLLSEHADLRDRLRQREAKTVLTPHAGEFQRLADSLDAGIPTPGEDRIEAARAMALELGCCVLLKGRCTVIAYGVRVCVIDAGSSWGATAGSGDVLSGLAGAWLAQQAALGTALDERYPEFDRSLLPDDYTEVETAVHLHSVAAALSAETPEGPAPTSASRIAAAIPRANAWRSPQRPG